jgi:hypothetical protein
LTAGDCWFACEAKLANRPRGGFGAKTLLAVPVPGAKVSVRLPWFTHLQSILRQVIAFVHRHALRGVE